MKRLTKKGNRIVLEYNHLHTPSAEKIIETNRYNKLAELEDLMEKFDIESIEELEEIIQNGMRVSFDISST